ncbi:2-succinyl-5-enolpyruvyl-6-hydroxy-3-cyclohexene-1-carboxylic-acid synthase [Halorubraceae archaeon YAN]|nr:2-succinyl-5-enolpyruvyl-6-hydroxy-3-cyclohexene-1-carboxylic-acid synthase [Halorubraceae archaeon YAN]
MSFPNRNTLWAHAIVEEIARAGISAVCISPGSRSTPLTVAFAEHDDIHVFSHLDERSAAYFALGRARRTGDVTPLVCTSGTAATNFHPAVIEASTARVPLLLLTADRPPELRDSGANQTVDQEKLYGDAVRWYKDLPEPEATDRKLRSLRTDINRAIASATGTPSGPVHLNVPFRKPLEPVHVEGDIPDSLSALAATGRTDESPFVRTTAGTMGLGDRDVHRLAEAISVDRGLIVAGPADPPGYDKESLLAFAHASGFPVLADPLSGLRFGGQNRVAPIIGGYDAYVNTDATASWPEPEVVIRFGASPTSKPLRKYLASTDARQLLIDPAGQWREAEFTATDLISVDPSQFCARLARSIRQPGSPQWRSRWVDADNAHWSCVEQSETFSEGHILSTVVSESPDPATIVVSNSMPVRDLDRYGKPTTTSITALANRGASGIDGVVSTALGAGSATTDHLTLVIGDLAYYHDMNGLLALDRCDVDATIVLINNDGGGIFHMLPIESYDPPFTSQFKTPHGVDFEPTGELYESPFYRVSNMETFTERYTESITTPGSTIIEVQTDASESHEVRDNLQAETIENVSSTE